MTAVEHLTPRSLRADLAWWALYDQSFPANEREPADVILESLRRGVGAAFRLSVDGSTSGLATIHLLTSPAVVFIVYLAVTPGLRGHGHGARLFDAAWQGGAATLRARGLTPMGCVWEVDPPDAVAANDIARRRVRFFERQGGQLLDAPYRQPPLDGGSPVPMRLMFRPAEGQPVPAGAAVTALVRAIYREKYGALNGIDAATLDALLV